MYEICSRWKEMLWLKDVHSIVFKYCFFCKRNDQQMETNSLLFVSERVRGRRNHSQICNRWKTRTVSRVKPCHKGWKGTLWIVLAVCWSTLKHWGNNATHIPTLLQVAPSFFQNELCDLLSLTASISNASSVGRRWCAGCCRLKRRRRGHRTSASGPKGRKRRKTASHRLSSRWQGIRLTAIPGYSTGLFRLGYILLMGSVRQWSC